jgi:3-dehydro-L-gulonate 2-dehydrogenase
MMEQNRQTIKKSHIRIAYLVLKSEFSRILLGLGFEERKAELCASIFAANTRDGVFSHGINRFPAFVEYVREGLVDIHAEPEIVERQGTMEVWDGHLGAGVYNATLAMDRAIALAKEHGMGCVALRHTNHWMRGGTYGWQAAEAGCIGICFTNTIANMPPWGGKEPRLGNNPLVIAVPRPEGHVVLDMALSQFAYGKLQQYSAEGGVLPVPGGYTEQGALTTDPKAVYDSQRALPVGFWKGSGLSLILDVVLTALTGGQSVARITAGGKEKGVSQLFLCLHQSHYHEPLIEEIIRYTKSSAPAEAAGRVGYPGEHTLATRRRHEAEGIPIEEDQWEALRRM